MQRVGKLALTLLSWNVISILLIFIIRRWLFVAAAWQPDPVRQTPPPPLDWPNILLLVPLRNEAEALPELLAALDDLHYPAGKCNIVLINDGSTDTSERICQVWASNRSGVDVISLAQNVGKAQALNIGLQRFDHGEIVVIYDADERPAPEALYHLVAPFSDPQVGGTSGRRVVSNAQVSPAASYTTFEGLVHQLITMRAKDRLNLAPALLGANCAYRRVALADVDGFRTGALLEDSDLTVRLAQAGWMVHFITEAISCHEVPVSVRGYWRQHTRWARGFNDVAQDQAKSLSTGNIPWPLRLELLIFSLGYLDRVALLLAGGLLVIHRPMRRILAPVIALNLLTPWVQIIAALKIDQAPSALWRRLGWVPIFFSIDLAMAVTGLWTTLWQMPQVWEERRARR